MSGFVPTRLRTDLSLPTTRSGHLSSYRHTWRNVRIRVRAKPPGTTALGAQQSFVGSPTNDRSRPKSVARDVVRRSQERTSAWQHSGSVAGEPAIEVAGEPTQQRPAWQRGQRDGDDELMRQELGDVGVHMLEPQRPHKVRCCDQQDGCCSDNSRSHAVAMTVAVHHSCRGNSGAVGSGGSPSPGAMTKATNAPRPHR